MAASIHTGDINASKPETGKVEVEADAHWSLLKYSVANWPMHQHMPPQSVNRGQKAIEHAPGHN